MTTPVQLPWAPLGALLGRFDVNREPCGSNAAALAQLLGVSPRQVFRWRAEGVSLNVADRICATVGRHPAEVWDIWSLDDVLIGEVA
jgi:hypothetical protein